MRGADPRIALGIVLVVATMLPPAGPWLEARMLRHLLGQYPLLLTAGISIGLALADRMRAQRPAMSGQSAGPALLTGMLALVFWLIPRWVDAAAGSGAIDAAKAATLVLLAGLPLGWGWRFAGPILRSLVWANAAVMAAVMGWLQMAIPSRLCNAYLITDQIRTGRDFMLLALAIVIFGLVRALWGRPGPAPADPA